MGIGLWNSKIAETSSFSETEISPELNPLILICKTPGYDGKYLK